MGGGYIGRGAAKFPIEDGCFLAPLDQKPLTDSSWIATIFKASFRENYYF